MLFRKRILTSVGITQFTSIDGKTYRKTIQVNFLYFIIDRLYDYPHGKYISLSDYKKSLSHKSAHRFKQYFQGLQYNIDYWRGRIREYRLNEDF